MKAPPPYDDYPYYGRYESDHAHAPFMIVRCLMQLGLAGWSATLLDWLGRYDGLEEHLGQSFDPDPRLDPVLCVRDVLIRHAAIWPAPDPGQRLSPAQRRERMESIVEDVLQLEFISAYAWWYRPGKNHTDWDSLEEDWLWFIQLGPDLTALRQVADDIPQDGLHMDSSMSTEEDRQYCEDIREILLQEFLGEKT